MLFKFEDSPLGLEQVKDFVFERKTFSSFELSSALKQRIEASHNNLHTVLKQGVPIYGVTTGLGDSSFRYLKAEQSQELQENLIAYLQCGTGPLLPEVASRATLLIRTNSLSRGYSGVSLELVERMTLYLTYGWAPVTPREGSLGASGDLIPLSYLAAAIQGRGMFHSPEGLVSVAEVLAAHNIEPYRLQPKEGLALVNGTSAMAGLALLNLTHAHFILNLATVCTSWMVIALLGRTESFGVLVNERAQAHRGQARVAQTVRQLLQFESYETVPLKEGPVQDRYSLRCAPQVLGPILETIDQNWRWLEEDINSVSDNPLFAADGDIGTGGNFYGGYLTHSQDYLKICVAHMADLLDRQLMLLMDDKQNKGLPPNLAGWPTLPDEQRFLHHGLKGLHQSVSALTSEIMAKALPNSIFSRSSESHNQDKVSLGMSAAVQCHEMLEQMFNLTAMVMICLAQALDLRKVTVSGEPARGLYTLLRKAVPFVSKDIALSKNIAAFAADLKRLSLEKGEKIIKI